MPIRSITFLGGIYALTISGGTFVLLMMIPGAPAWCWFAAIAIGACGVWDLYRAFEGRKKDAEVAAELERKISKLNDP